MASTASHKVNKVIKDEHKCFHLQKNNNNNNE